LSSTCTVLHSDWEIKRWTKDNIKELTNDEFAKDLDIDDENILHLLALKIFGGIYFQADFICL
jgi:hypothetical protein